VISVIAWKWQKPGYRSVFTAQHVNVLFKMVRRHYSKFRPICVTDNWHGLESHIEVVPLWSEWGDIQSPHGGHNPSCYRRLKMFSPEAERLFGPRFVSLDLDTVIVRDLSPLWDRPEDFVMWGETDPRSFYNGSMQLMSANARPQVWTRFNPASSPQEAKAAGRFGSDQGWISHVLGPGEATWKDKDGVYSFRLAQHLNNGAKPLPENARIIMFHGGQDPWGPRAQRLPWVRRHYQ